MQNKTYLKLIEPYWNVNATKAAAAYKNMVKLIEPYWNVNEIEIGDKIYSVDKLIEPYWNVNRRHMKINHMVGYKINRTILECK